MQIKVVACACACASWFYDFSQATCRTTSTTTATKTINILSCIPTTVKTQTRPTHALAQSLFLRGHLFCGRPYFAMTVHYKAYHQRFREARHTGSATRRMARHQVVLFSVLLATTLISFAHGGKPGDDVVFTISETKITTISAVAAKKVGKSRPAFEDLSPEQRVERCEADYQPLFENVHKDLEWWKRTGGISLELMQKAIETHTGRSAAGTRKGFVAGFRDGVAILPDVPEDKTIGQHAMLQMTYMHSLVDLEQLFGKLIPDVDIIISTIDRPLVLAPNDTSKPALPVMRFGKSPAHTDILIPNFHFHSANHNAKLADMTDQINLDYPWAKRKPLLFGRFSRYQRHIHRHDPYTQRLGANGTNICLGTSDQWGSGMHCTLREHFITWAQDHKSLMDIHSAPKIPFLEHAGYKYLAHLDGQGLSSRLDQLLSLGSLIFKEESGYYAFYHHLLKPYEHYVPFWKKGPEDLLPALEWAKKNDQKAEQIGKAAQLVAKTYLNREARACYWYKLLKEYAALMTYKPSETGHMPYRKYNKPIAMHLKEKNSTATSRKLISTFGFRP